MTKITFKTDDGQIMELTSNDPILKLNFPKSNTRTVDIDECFSLVSIITKKEAVSA